MLLNNPCIPLTDLSSSVGFLPGRKVFLPHEGEKQGESISAIVSAISAGQKGQNLLKPDNN